MMVGDGSFLVEDFINAITTQLDRVQDALRLKAVNRPLTYALKDFALALQVFVEMDGDGNVRFRTSGPNETGSSTVNLNFTTITKPMIEENTISLAMTRSPSLEELGLDPDEQRRLSRYGVFNAAQLQRLGSSTGVQAISRLSAVPLERLRSALRAGGPGVGGVHAEPGPPVPVPGPSPRPFPTPSQSRPLPPRPIEPPEASLPPIVRGRPVPPRPPGGIPLIEPGPGARGIAAAPTVAIAPDTRRLHLTGRNLIGESGPPVVRLNNEVLPIASAEDDRLVVELPGSHRGGALSIELHDGRVEQYDLTVEPGPPHDRRHEERDGGRHDPWSPRNGGARPCRT
jgi:hypothetical protein